MSFFLLVHGCFAIWNLKAGFPQASCMLLIIIGVMQGSYRDNGKENRNYYSGLRVLHGDGISDGFGWFASFDQKPQLARFAKPDLLPLPVANLSKSKSISIRPGRHTNPQKIAVSQSTSGIGPSTLNPNP